MIKHVYSFLAAGHIICIPTTPTLAPKIADIHENFFKGDYFPKTMSFTAISGLTGIPQISMPIGTVNDVPFGVSFLSGSGTDIQLVTACHLLQQRINAIDTLTNHHIPGGKSSL